MNHKIRLGPIAVFLVVVAVVLAMLATLTLSTARADKVMAERFAAVTAVRYDLEAQGQQFLRDYASRIAAGDADADRQEVFEGKGYTLEVEVSEPDGNGNFEIVKWDLQKSWTADDPFKHIWKGAD